MRPFAASLLLLCSLPAAAAVSTRTVPSPLGMSAHNVSFDGRLFVGRGANVWDVRVLRPERIKLAGDFPNVADAFSPRVEIDPNPEGRLNALALCEEKPQPYACGLDGTASATGGYACYDEVVIYSRGFPDQAGIPDAPVPAMERRRLLVVVSAPRTAAAAVARFAWTSAAEPLTATLAGIEPAVTRDGKLMVWNGITHDDNGLLLYSFNDTPCAAAGWSEPRSIAAMASDARLTGKYRLAEKPLRAPDGSVFAPGDKIYGAYPWLFPDGEALNFTATVMPCRTYPVPGGCGVPQIPCQVEEDPRGCGPRRNALSVIGYPTNWTLAHIDGDVNPDTDQTVRLFFTSPTPQNAPPLPATRGQDVWPFFGGNTDNYTEILFDDGLDGNYAGLWHMNELISRGGELDVSGTPDSSGYFNTARIGALFPARNLLSGATTFDGTGGGITIADEPSLDPTGGLTVEMLIKPDRDPDCDAKVNWRVLLLKGKLDDQAYSIVEEEGIQLDARVRVAGGATYFLFSDRRLPAGTWSRVAFTYSAATGDLAWYVDGRATARGHNPPAALAPSTGPLLVGGLARAGGPYPACPDGSGAFAGSVDALDVSARPYVLGASMPARNNGILGKAMDFDGSAGKLIVAHASSLNPVNAITLQMAVKPASDPDCDARPNWRYLLGKGNIGAGAYSLVLEEDRHVTARVRVAGGTQVELNSQAALPVGAWSQIGATYDAQTGLMAFFIDGKETSRKSNPPAPLEGTSDPLTIGGPPGTTGAAPACPPQGAGAFHGTIDEVAVSRVVRDLRPPAAAPPDAGPPDASLPATSGGGGGGGGGCAVGGRSEPAPGLLVFLMASLAAVRRAGRGRRRRRS